MTRNRCEQHQTKISIWHLPRLGDTATHTVSSWGMKWSINRWICLQVNVDGKARRPASQRKLSFTTYHAWSWWWNKGTPKVMERSMVQTIKAYQVTCFVRSSSACSHSVQCVVVTFCTCMTCPHDDKDDELELAWANRLARDEYGVDFYIPHSLSSQNHDPSIHFVLQIFQVATTIMMTALRMPWFISNESVAAQRKRENVPRCNVAQHVYEYKQEPASR
jgi:hypothetical protein